MTFKETNLNQKIRSAVKKAGFEEMTPIQEQAIPAVLAGHDMIGCAQTGTGKTAAFALPILHMLNGRVAKRPRALIMTPTRELAQQIFENFKKYGRYLKLRTACIYGGASQYKQIDKLNQGCDILIATPGRLLDFAGRGIVTLEDVQIFVLDEADQMLDMGFIPDIREIAGMIPDDHQTLMFSATMPAEVEKLARDLLTDPVDIRVAPTSSPAETVDQRVFFVKGSDKLKVLEDYLGRDEVTRSIVFTATKEGADKLVDELAKLGIKSLAIHGDKRQGQRKDTLQRFRTGQFDVLVATDVMARGIDVKNVSHVFNYDMPREPENYIHRIGRSGRAGESGVALTLCSRGDLFMLRRIQHLIKKDIPEEVTEWTVDIKKQDKLDEAERRAKMNAKRNARRDRKRAEAKAERQAAKKAKKNENTTSVSDNDAKTTANATVSGDSASRKKKRGRRHNDEVVLGNSVRNVRDEKTSKHAGYFVVGGKIVSNGSSGSTASGSSGSTSSGMSSKTGKPAGEKKQSTAAKKRTKKAEAQPKRANKNKRSDHSTKKNAKQLEYENRTKRNEKSGKAGSVKAAKAGKQGKPAKQKASNSKKAGKKPGKSQRRSK